MQTIPVNAIKNYSKFIGKVINKRISREKILTKDIIANLKQAEKEIEEGKLIQANVVFKELRDDYEC